MPRQSSLKVYRTAIGFHDAYVAAPSQKAALEAWGASTNLFAIGSADVVTDPALTAAPLASSGTVVKRTRGSLGEHLREADRTARKPAQKKREPASAAKPSRPSRRPSRDALDKAEAEREALRAGHDAAMDELERREAELRRERHAAEARHQAATAKLDTRIERIRARYEQALERWRAEL